MTSMQNGCPPALPGERKAVRRPAGLRLAVPVIRAGYGLALLATPGPMIRWCTGHPASGRSCAVARVLGMRHLAQAALTLLVTRSPRAKAGPLLAGSAIDLAHASSMAVLAAERQVRRACLADALAETVLAAAGARAAVAVRPGPRETGAAAITAVGPEPG
jgi:hypothetical protein